MKLNKLPICLAYLDSPRGRAYLNAFLDLGLYPEEIVVMGNNYDFSSGFMTEAEEYEYDVLFYDYRLSLTDVFPEDVKLVRVDTQSINDPELVSTLRNCESEYILFSGGGILSSQTLSMNKQFLHIHPGYVPEYRGSTCFYYSLLEKGELGATAFIMTPQIDEGPVILRKKFKINVALQENQTCFIDFVLDPYIRMQVLKEVLLMFKDESGLQEDVGSTGDDCKQGAYYVMHPVLRRLCWEKINAISEPFEAQGIHEVNLR